jgi:hypothetical protein
MTQATASLRPDASAEQIAGKLNQLLRDKHERPNGQEKAAPLPSVPIRREPGVYFGLPAADYLADPSLGSSDLKRLAAAPILYWHYSHMNPTRSPSPDSAAKLRGRALHALVLQGEEGFKQAFAVKPSHEDYPGCLVTLEDLKAKLRFLCEPTSGTKHALSKRIKIKLPDVVVFEDVLAIFKAVVERDKLEVITKDTAREVRKAAAAITSNPHLRRAFQGGIPELSVFWTENGVPLKARFDYVKPAAIVDLKSFANQREHSVDTAIRMAIGVFRHDVQAAHYFDAYAALRSLVKDGRVFGSCKLRPDWHKRLADETVFIWVFHSVDAPITRALQLSETSAALNRARREVAMAKRAYAECLERWGTSAWFDDEPPRELTEEDMAPWLRESVEVC